MTAPSPAVPGESEDEHCVCGAHYDDVTLAHVMACCGVPNADVVAENTLRRVEGRRDLLPYPEVSP